MAHDAPVSPNGGKHELGFAAIEKFLFVLEKSSPPSSELNPVILL